MARNFPSWIDAYVKYAGVTEAPRRMAFWAGVSAVAGALRRHVWIDMKRFQWTPNFYIIFVAPPGIVAKSTSADIAMDLLKQVPGIKFGPDTVTWPALVTAFANAQESFMMDETWYPMSPLTLVSSEMGSLINPMDRQMVDLYITLWDGRKGYEKVTKMSGNDTISAPWINMLACTTPQWLADNMPAATIGGGFTSRCIFLYADSKERYIPFVDEMVDDNDEDTRDKLIQDLEHISVNLVGPYNITKEARDWYRPVYEEFWKNVHLRMDDSMMEGYAARKQTHLFKTALILSAAQRDEKVITLDDLQLASLMLDDVESTMGKVFSRIGKSDDSLAAEKFIQHVKKNGELSYEQAYRMVHAYFPDFRNFEGMVSGAVKSGYLILIQKSTGLFLRAKEETPSQPPTPLSREEAYQNELLERQMAGR